MSKRRTSIASFLADAARRGRATAFVHRRGLRVERWSYGRLAETAYAFARELEARGIGRGDRVLFRAENCAEWAAAFFGCVLRGAIVVPLDVESAPDFAARVQRQVAAKLLLAGETGATADEIEAGLASVRLTELDALVARHARTPYEAASVEEDDLVEIIFTSGTTAEPRGVCITHRNLLANLAPLEEEIGKYLRWERFVHPLRFLNLLPLSHVFGQFMGIFVPQLLGGEVHFQNSLNPSEVVENVRRERISVIVTVPRLLDTLREAVERRETAGGRAEAFRRKFERAAGVSFVRRMWLFRRIHARFGWKFWAFVSGGASLSEETERFWRRLGFAVLQGYGMTETASLITVNHPFKQGRGSVGKTLPGQEIRLDEHGEILVRGANVSPGYWSGGVKPLADAEGWLHTGDLGEMDAAGNIYFKGRKKDVIVTAAGLNIHPEDLEAALLRQTEVRACAVVGIEDERTGTEPVAVLIMRDERADAAAAVARANESLARHQQIRRWHVWPEADFPRTPTHKVRKREIVDRLKAEAARAPSNGGGGKSFAATSAPSLLPSLIPALAARVGGATETRLDASSNLATDLKLDSLGRVELLSALEDRYQIEIDEAAFTAATTLGDIEKIVQEGTTEQEATTRAYPYPSWTQSAPVKWLRIAIFYTVVLPITSVLCRVRVRGREHLRSLRGPALFVSNHITYFDHALILSALPGRYRRNFAIAMEGERLRRWRRSPDGAGLFTRLRRLAQYVLTVIIFNTFPLPQKSGFRRSFAYAGESVDRGYSVLVFPEGTRTEHGRLNPFMAGTGLLAAQLGVPVVPVRIDGLYELKRAGRRGYARPGTVSVSFGAPTSYTPDTEATEISADLQRRVAGIE
ncbi:MAG TPA: AMP-binding protein [Pyrinomonadaceae bacterium]|nr:AMP-binding protein [Pyrinomonadaceae bacterium]